MPDLEKAISILRAGGLVAFPTETVYGLGADAINPKAIERIFRAKGRPSTNPLIVHVANQTIAQRYVTQWPDAAKILTQHYWPGPLTLVLPKHPSIVDQATAGRQTVGLRAPNHPLTLNLLHQFNGPLAGPSANRSNHLSPTTAQHVRDDLGSAVDLVLDGGPCTVGIESTVLDLTTTSPTILRPGGVTRAQIEEQIGPVQIFTGSISTETSAASPGQQALHYAPKAAAFRFETARLAEVASVQPNPDRPQAVLTLSRLPLPMDGNRPMPSDPAEYARVLYSTLRELDRQNVQVVLIEMPPGIPEWAAIHDRLTRATKPWRG